MNLAIVRGQTGLALGKPVAVYKCQRLQSSLAFHCVPKDGISSLFLYAFFFIVRQPHEEHLLETQELQDQAQHVSRSHEVWQ